MNEEMNEEKEVKLEENNNSNNSNKNKSKTLTIIFIVVGLLLIVCASYIAINMQSDDSNKQESKEEQNKDEQNKDEQNNNKEENNNLEKLKEKYLNKKDYPEDISNDQEVKNKLTSIDNDLLQKSNDIKAIDVGDNDVLKLFDIYHTISNDSKEEIAIYQLSENDLLNVSCEFYTLPNDKLQFVGKVEPMWCGTLTEEMQNAWNSENGSLYVELMSKNTTKAIKVETLKNKVMELFGTNEIKDSIFLSPERAEDKWWMKVEGTFIFVEKVDGKDYYAITSASGGDPWDYNSYYINAAYKNDENIYIVYEVLSNGLPTTYNLNVMTLKKQSDGNYIFVEDKEYFRKEYSNFR